MMRKVDVKEKARARELRILNQWKQEDTFRKSMDNRLGKPNFVFYEGPPTANGQPHIGHVLGRVIKDFIGRYKTMSGYRVVRKAGWESSQPGTYWMNTVRRCPRAKETGSIRGR